MVTSRWEDAAEWTKGRQKAGQKTIDREEQLKLQGTRRCYCLCTDNFNYNETMSVYQFVSEFASSTQSATKPTVNFLSMTSDFRQSVGDWRRIVPVILR